MRLPRLFYGWWMTIGGAVAMALHGGLIHYGFSAYFTPIITEFHWSRTELSGVFSLSRLEGGLVAPVGGILIDRWGPRPLMLLGITMMSAGFVLLSQVDSLFWFYVVYCVFIAGGGTFGPTHTAVTSLGNWFVRRRSTAMGVIMAGFGLGGSLVPLVAWSITQHGWRTTMVMAGIVLWVVGMPLALLMRHRPEQYGMLPDGEQSPEAPPARAAHPHGFQDVAGEVSVEPMQLLRMPAFWLLATIFGIRQMVTSSVVVHFIPFMGDIGFSAEAAASVLAIIAVGSIVGRVFFGWLGDHMDKRIVIGVTLGLISAAMLVMSRAEGMAQIIIYVPLYALSYGGSVPIVPATLGEYFGRKNFATVQGLANTVQMVGHIGGPLFAGFVFDVTGSYRFAFVSFAGAALVATLMLLAVRRPRT